MTSQSKISIITVVFNDADGLLKTIKSVVNQTYSNIEYIIIDGGSTDGTVDIIKKYEDKITHWVSEPDAGIYDAMNKGIDLVSGQWINFINAGDNFFDTSIVGKVVPLLDNDMWVVYGDTVLDYGAYTSLRINLDLSNMYYGQVLGHQSSFTNAIYQKKNPFSLEYKIAGDYDFFLKAYIENKNKFKRISLIISIFSMNGVSSNNEVSSTLERIKILKKIKQFKMKVRLSYYLTLLKIIIKKNLPLKIVKRLNTRSKSKESIKNFNTVKNKSGIE
ncbi:MAG: glycosyltransferase [Gammaproteobacteria bacterium]|uniref:Glycosyl transferase family 2 n=1 Tax=endosymbiont of Bathymodiolus septemdierum str. Myojin knoll TaxID=1303921 RepID=A0A0P0URJ8_9GAMM|nr:glycosyltransferase family 2 protein [Bathymodiolus septemdierum thioautotrophic gill symbiont]RUA05756.1 MAG: glycosyltransferase [Gammaproteobacteria bacterium]BAS67697.1 glycosyl transferase family 2 [endosymbiont of Bathymodiolus septemdierum str. Myojin knoll]